MTKIVVLNYVDEHGNQHRASLPGFDLETAQQLVDHMLREELPFQAFIDGKPQLLSPIGWKGCSVTVEPVNDT
jgi:hypothetical protein